MIPLRSISRVALIALVLSGCSGAPLAATPAPTRAPTPSPAPTAGPSATPGISASPRATATPSPSPTEQAGPRELPPPGALKPGTYFGDSEGTRYTFTVPAGWINYSDHCCTIYTREDTTGAAAFLEGDIDSLYARACHWSGTEFTFGPTVDDLANALVSLPDFEVSEPAEVTLSGFHGKRVAVTVPMDVDTGNPDCDNSEYHLNGGRYYQAAGQTDDFWILDVDGQRMTPAFSRHAHTAPEVLEQLEQIRDSLVIEPL